MNDYGIPIIEPTVDFTKVPPIHQKRTITFVNHFIIHTVTFLNKFALCCEERLFEFENKLQRVEASLELLESRLSSIPEADPQAQTESSVKNESNDGGNGETAKPDVTDSMEETAAPAAESNDEKMTNSNMQPISKDPRYIKYFKMVQYRVPLDRVKSDMKRDGLDPSILNNPDQLVPIIDVPNSNATTTDEDDA